MLKNGEEWARRNIYIMEFIYIILYGSHRVWRVVIYVLLNYFNELCRGSSVLL